MLTLFELQRKIVEKRKQLEEIVTIQGVNGKEALAVSQSLDELYSQYYRQKYNSRPRNINIDDYLLF